MGKKTFQVETPPLFDGAYWVSPCSRLLQTSRETRRSFGCGTFEQLSVKFGMDDAALSLVAVALGGERQLAIGRHLVGLILQQARHIGVGDAVVVAAEADVVLFQFDGPEGGIQLAVLVLPVRVHASHEAQQHQHHQDDDGQDDDVELRPGDLCQGGGGVVGGAAQAGQQRLGGGGGA